MTYFWLIFLVLLWCWYAAMYVSPCLAIHVYVLHVYKDVRACVGARNVNVITYPVLSVSDEVMKCVLVVFFSHVHLNVATCSHVMVTPNACAPCFGFVCRSRRVDALKKEVAELRGKLSDYNLAVQLVGHIFSLS